jgi:predicted nucleic acid-binding Zn ribbon protein
VIQKFSDEPLTVCDCGEEGSVERLLSAPAFQFKGSGWYITDYARSGAKGDGKAADGKSADGKAESKADAKSDAKPAAAPAAPASAPASSSDSK